MSRILAHAVARTSKCSHIIPVLGSLYWLKIKMHSKCALTYKVLTTTQPTYLNNLISVELVATLALHLLSLLLHHQHAAVFKNHKLLFS